MELNETARLLYEKYGTLTLNTKQLAEVLHLKTTRVLLNQISAEKCPVHTFKLGKMRVADIRDVAEYLDKSRQTVLAIQSERETDSRVLRWPPRAGKNVPPKRS